MAVANGKAAFAYGVVCIVWGSTYLAIRVGVHHLPPALFAASRFLIAGTLLLVVMRLLRRPLRSRRADWATNIVSGVLMLGVGNGLLVWAEQFVTSGVAAIIIVTVSLWLALFDAVIPGSRARPTVVQVIGLFVGLAGTVMLFGTDLTALRQTDWRGPVALTIASAAWAAGSILLQRRPVTTGPYVSAAIQMLAGGAALLVAGAVANEWSRMTFSWPGAFSLGYLVVFGSIVAFTAYVYVLHHWPATVVGTYAYVNTVVAVFLGWLLLSEPVTGRTVLSMSVILGAVLWVRAAGRRTGPAAAVGALRPARKEA